jgi:hypothetical protein
MLILFLIVSCLSESIYIGDSLDSPIFSSAEEYESIEGKDNANITDEFVPMILAFNNPSTMMLLSECSEGETCREDPNT